MFIAMNRFQVKPDQCEAFERVWRERDSFVAREPGFVAFHMLKGPARADHVLYVSHTHWRSRADFEAWTRSEAFSAAHRDAGARKDMYVGPPQFEGFDAVLDLVPA